MEFTLSTFAGLIKTWQVIQEFSKATGLGEQAKPDKYPTNDEFNFIRSLQKTNRRHFAEIAYRLPGYQSGRGFFKYAPLLCHDEWIPKEPIPLSVPAENLQDDSEQFITTYASKSNPTERNSVQLLPVFSDEAKFILPRHTDHVFDSLSAAIKFIEQPPEELFVSRPSYALSKVSTGNTCRLTFQESGYFDYINCGELLALELIMKLKRLGNLDHLDTDQQFQSFQKVLPLRDFAGEWNAVSFRPSIAGINSLTVFIDRKSNQAFFPMLSRLKNLGSAMGTQHVIPAGEFQPTTDSPVAWRNHCTLWQTILREFAEEVLLDAEAKSNQVDMLELANRETIKPLLKLIRDGHWKSYYLGVAIDPLTLKPEILVVNIIERVPFFEDLKSVLDEDLKPVIDNGKLPISNKEGVIIRGPSGIGEELSLRNLLAYCNGALTLPAGVGCIELFIRHSKSIIPWNIR